MAQTVECLPRERTVLSSNPGTTRERERKRAQLIGAQ
jgi:hypothetical protein